MMWVVLVREPAPDAAYWSGRRWLAALDAIAWPAIGFFLLGQVPRQMGVVLPMVGVVLAAVALARVLTAVWMNHRYRFTTWRLGRIVFILLLVGGAFKLALMWH